MSVIQDVRDAIGRNKDMSMLIDFAPNSYDKPPLCFIEFGGLAQVGQSLRSIIMVYVFSCKIDDDDTEKQLEIDTKKVAEYLRDSTGHSYNSCSIMNSSQDPKWEGWLVSVLTFIGCR